MSTHPVEKSPSDPDAKHINFKVKGMDDRVVCFKMKKQNTFRKLFVTYCERGQLVPHLVWFNFKERQIYDYNTPLNVDMEEGDTIQVHWQQDIKNGPVNNFKVQGTDGQVVYFKVKMRDTFKNLFAAYCERFHLVPREVRFNLKGKQIYDYHTPFRVNMMEGDTIQVQDIKNGPANADVERINLKVRSAFDNQSLHFKLKKQTPFKKLFDAFCERCGIVRHMARFLYEGSKLQDHNTPLEFEMEDGDVIECFLRQVGG